LSHVKSLEPYLIPGEKRIIKEELLQSSKHLVPKGFKVYGSDFEVSEAITTRKVNSARRVI